MKCRLLNHNIDVNLRSKRDWLDVKLFKPCRHSTGYHFVWGKLSASIDQDHLMEVQVHSGCGGPVESIGRDGISFCTECEAICEGETEYMTAEEAGLY